MRYYCDISLKDFKKKNKNSHLKFKSHKEFEKYKHVILSLKNVDIKVVDGILYLYTKDHNEKFNHYLLKGQLKQVFNYQVFKYAMTDMIDNKTSFSWSNYLKEIFDILKEKGYHFNHIAEMVIITLAHKRDLTYNFL